MKTFFNLQKQYTPDTYHSSRFKSIPIEMDTKIYSDSNPFPYTKTHTTRNERNTQKKHRRTKDQIDTKSDTYRNLYLERNKERNKSIYPSRYWRKSILIQIHTLNQIHTKTHRRTKDQIKTEWTNRETTHTQSNPYKNNSTQTNQHKQTNTNKPTQTNYCYREKELYTNKHIDSAKKQTITDSWINQIAPIKQRILYCTNTQNEERQRYRSKKRINSTNKNNTHKKNSTETNYYYRDTNKSTPTYTQTRKTNKHSD